MPIKLSNNIILNLPTSLWPLHWFLGIGVIILLLFYLFYDIINEKYESTIYDINTDK